MANVRVNKALRCVVAVSSAAASIIARCHPATGRCHPERRCRVVPRCRSDLRRAAASNHRGPGIIGDSFTDDLRAKVNKNINLYAVNYPADTEADLGANDIVPANPVTT